MKQEKSHDLSNETVAQNSQCTPRSVMGKSLPVVKS